MPKIALIQQEAVAEPAENKRLQEAAIREAAAGGANIVCTQEMCTTLYFCRTQDCDLFDTADPIPGPWTDSLCALAKELGIVIVAAGFEKRATGIYHNTACNRHRPWTFQIMFLCFQFTICIDEDSRR